MRALPFGAPYVVLRGRRLQGTGVHHRNGERFQPISEIDFDGFARQVGEQQFVPVSAGDSERCGADGIGNRNVDGASGLQGSAGGKGSG